MSQSPPDPHGPQPPASSDAVPQSRLLETVLPLIEAGNQRFEKYRRVEARPARDGETIVTRPADGEETRNVADANSTVVRNLTGAREEYIVANDHFQSHYSKIRALDGDWSLFAPRGEILAIEITDELTALLGVERQFAIVAAWGSEQRAGVGDMLATPLPDKGEVYRISQKEMGETYRPASSDRE